MIDWSSQFIMWLWINCMFSQYKNFMTYKVAHVDLPHIKLAQNLTQHGETHLAQTS